MPSRSSPSIVVIRFPSCIAAKVMQERTRRPSTCTVHAPHSPRSHAFFVPVKPSSSRNAVSNVVRGSTVIVRTRPLTVMPTCTRASSCVTVFSHAPRVTVAAGFIVSPSGLPSGDGVADQRYRLLEFRLAAPGDVDERAFFDEALGGGEAYTATAARDDSDFSLELRH